MSRVEISDDVLDFIARRIDSVPHLETLLLLWENPSIAWTDEQVSSRVYVSRDKAKGLLQDIARHGFIAASAEISGGYSYAPSWDEAQLMPKLAATYRRHLVYVANLIHAKAASGAVHEFARAFKFKNKE
jgi:hypothetical protein